MFAAALALFASCPAPRPALPPQEPHTTALTREIAGPDGMRVLVDLSTQKLRCEVETELGFAWEGRTVEERLAPRATDLLRVQDRFAPAGVLALEAKLFDDGLYAAVELAAQRGAGSFPSKRELLTRWAQAALAGGEEAPRVGTLTLWCAAGLGGAQLDAPSSWRGELDRIRTTFLADPLRSKPLGFYTWSEELQAIFRQDRLLQTPLKAREQEQLARVLRDDPELRAGYERWARLNSGLTNPFARPDLRSLLGEGGLRATEACAMPASRSHEGDLVMRLFANRPIPEGFDLAAELVQRVRDDSLDLRPRADSGWYDHQSWALAALATPERQPEAERVHFGTRYRAELVALLRGLLALTRETHVKQVEIPAPGAAFPGEAPRVFVLVQPELSSEPLVTHYARRAESYAFVEQVLVRAFGEDALAGMHRLTATGPREESLLEELRSVRRLFRGAALQVARELGIETEAILAAQGGDEAARETFRSWLASMSTDPDLAADVRMMVPVFYDLERRKTKVWCVLGWTRKRLAVEFEKEPSWIRVGGGAEAARVEVEFSERGYEMVYPVSAELYVDEPLDREEFRALCDTQRTQKAILAALRER